jgi:hypothetical protein
VGLRWRRPAQPSAQLVRWFVKLGDWWSDHPATDFIPVCIIVGFHFSVVQGLKHGDFLSWPSTEGRIATYAAGAGVMALIAGFTGTAIAQYGSSSGPIVDALRRSFGETIRRSWASVVTWLLISALLCIIAMSIDRKTGTFGSQWVFEFAMCAGIAKFARLLFLFRLFLNASDRQSVNRSQRPMPQIR